MYLSGNPLALPKCLLHSPLLVSPFHLQGYIFRFMEADVTSGSKPRGITDLAEVTEVSDAKDTTGRNNSLKLVASKGNVNYIADSETEQVEWISAIEAAICKIHDDKDPNPPPERKLAASSSSSSSSKPQERSSASYMRQLESSFSSVGGSRASAGNNREVKVVGYEGPSGNGSSQSYGGFRNYPTPAAPSKYGASAPPPTEDFSALSLGYGIAGANTSMSSSTAYSSAPAQPSYSGSGDLNYGGGMASYGGGGGSGNISSYVTDPNYGGGGDSGAPLHSAPSASSQSMPVAGYQYDVFSQGPEQPANNYPAMQATVADYTSQGYSHQPPPSAAPHGDYWSQQPQSPAAPQSDYWAQQQQQEPAVKDSNYSAQPPVQGWDGLQGGYAQAQYGASATQPDQQYSSLASTYAPSQQQPGYGGSEPASWQVCYTPEGQQYWHNVATGMTQWETPAGMA